MQMGLIEPKDFGSDGGEEVYKDKWFTLLKFQPSNFLLSVFYKESYKILLNTSPSKIIAEGDSLKGIKEDWDWIHSFLQNDDMSSDDFLQFITSKIIALNKLKGQREREASEMKTFLESFGFVDTVIGKFRCSIMLNSPIPPIPGYMHITNYSIIFHYPLVKMPIIIKYKDIKCIEKDFVLAWMKCIKITVDSDETYIFTVFSDRDAVFESIANLLEVYIQRIFEKEEVNALKKFTSRRKSRLLPDSSIDDNQETAESSKSKNIVLDRFDLTYKSNLLSSYKELLKFNLNVELIKKFHFPTTEKSQKSCQCSLFIKDLQISEKGKLILTEHFIVFLTYGKRAIKAIFPLFDIVDIQFDSDKLIKFYTSSLYVEIHFLSHKHAASLHNTMQFFYPMSKEYCGYLKEKAFLKLESYERTRQLATLTFKHTEPNREVANSDINWSEFCFYFMEGYSMIVYPSFYDLVESGIIHSLRGKLWQFYSGSMYYKILFETNGYYRKLLDKMISPSTEMLNIMEDIEKDLERSFPEHPFYQSENGINSLRNVLMACGLHNEEIGYCQAMNIICSLLLLYMDEESSFYLMLIICDQILHRNYSQSMSGSIVNQNVFVQLLSLKLPLLYDHLILTQVPIIAIVMPWLLCLFIDSLPLDTVLRILDMFLLDGVNVLYQASLAIFAIKQPQILPLTDSYDITSILREDLEISADDLVSKMKEFSDIDDLVLTFTLHQSHKLSKSIAKSWKKSLIKEVKASYAPNVPDEILHQLYNYYIDVIKTELDLLIKLTKDEYFILLNRWSWFASFTNEEKGRIYDLSSHDKNDLIHLGGIAKDLSNWIYSGVRQTCSFCLEIKELSGVPKLSYDQALDVIDLLYRVLEIDQAPKLILYEMWTDLNIVGEIDFKTFENYITSALVELSNEK